MDLGVTSGSSPLSSPFLAFLRAQARGPSAVLRETDFALVAETGIPGMVRVALKRPPLKGELTTLTNLDGIDGALWIVLPEAESTELDQVLSQLGFRVARDSPCLITSPNISSGTAGAAPIGGDDLESWRAIAAQAYPFGGQNAESAKNALGAMAAQEGCRFYLRREGGVPVACALAVVTARRAGLYWVATSRQHRRQGHAAALLRAVEADLAAAGVESLGLQSSEEGLPLYRNLGYRAVGTLRAWERVPRSLGEITRGASAPLTL